MVNPRVDQVQQRDDNTVEIHVQTDSFKPGREVEVSGYLIQGNSAYAAFNVKKHIPLDANTPADPNTPAELDVQLPAMDLNPHEEVTVVTRVAEVWPTILTEDKDSKYLGNGLKAVWKAEEYLSGKGPAGPEAPQGDGGSTGTTG
jgi:hypothetical protein